MEVTCAGATRTWLAGLSAAPGGGKTQWAPQGVLVEASCLLASARVTERPFEATVKLVFADAILGGDHPGKPLRAGTLRVDLEWEFAVSPLLSATIVQRDVARVEIGAAAASARLQWRGRVPAAPRTEGKHPTSHLRAVRVRIHQKTTVAGQANTSLDLAIAPRDTLRSSQ